METAKRFKAQASASRSNNDIRESLSAPEEMKRKLALTSPRSAREAVKATRDDEDVESDSLCLRSSRIPRKRLLAPWK